MQYRRLGNTGISVSALGFGAMRLPLQGDGTVDESRAVALLRHGIDSGINYVDTAYNYHGGESERIVGKALSDGYRDKVYLATKCPVWLIEKEEDFDNILKEQLTKLQTDRIDFYLLHAMDRTRFFEKVVKFHLIEKMAKAKEEGKIKYIGFSFHDSFEVFKEIIEYTDKWDFCQIQYNYVDVDKNPGVEGLKLASDRGLGLIAMEPLLGGKLANLSAHVAGAFLPEREPVEWALDFLWDQPEVSLLLSGMSDEKQVEDNLLYASRSSVGMIKQEERACYVKARETFEKMALVNCTKCRYCMPCPFGLDIPELFGAYNLSALSEGSEAKSAYEKQEKRAADCQGCKACEEKCPQHIDISGYMKEVSGFFTK